MPGNYKLGKCRSILVSLATTTDLRGGNAAMADVFVFLRYLYFLTSLRKYIDMDIPVTLPRIV